MKRVLTSIAIIGVLAASVIGLTNAFFSDSETSSGNIFQAGIFDLLVNGQNNPEAIVNVGDLKPGNEIFVDKTLTIQNPAKVWLHLIEYESGQGTSTEPENEEEAGVSKHDLENYLTYDLKIGEDVIIHFDDGALFPDVFSCWIPLGEIPAGDTIVEQSFHFDETVTNWAQGDTLTFSEEFYAEQLSNNPNAAPPNTGSNLYWNPASKKCELPTLIETLQIPANKNQLTFSTHFFIDGAQYKIKASTTANAGDTIDFDAKYSITHRIDGDDWTDVVSGYESHGPTLLDLMVNGSFVDWGAYNSSHEYWHQVTGDGNLFSFKIYDIYYPNNTGSLIVEIYKLP
jgi:predicted ribosomally synthesized peptide with SipW-like signal peptide